MAFAAHSRQLAITCPRQCEATSVGSGWRSGACSYTSIDVACWCFSWSTTIYFRKSSLFLKVNFLFEVKFNCICFTFRLSSEIQDCSLLPKKQILVPILAALLIENRKLLFDRKISLTTMPFSSKLIRRY